MNEGVSQIPALGAVGSTKAGAAVGAWGFHLGAVTQHIDGVVVLFWAFAIFFGTLVWYLRAEDKREGYPMEDPTRAPRAGAAVGFPPPPSPKTFTLMKGGTATMPHFDSPPEVPARHLHPFPGSAWVPTGTNPLRDPVGPASWCLREDEPLLQEGEKPQLVPLREVGGIGLTKLWPHVRGLSVSRPVPMLRGLADAAVLSALLTRRLGQLHPGALDARRTEPPAAVRAA